MLLPDPNSIVSPFVTGGGGASFEQRVAAFYLGQLLLESAPRGLESGQTHSVRFQRAFEGEPPDDLVIRAIGAGGEFKLALQCKHDLTWGDNETFNKALGSCWDAFHSDDFDGTLHFYGFGLGVAKAPFRAYSRVLHWARHSESGIDFIHRVETPRLASESQRTFVALMRARLDACATRSLSADELWRFLRSFVLVTFDVEGDSPSDEAWISTLLGTLLPVTLLRQERQEALKSLWNALIRCSAECHQSAGSHEGQSLRRWLIAQGVTGANGVDLLSAPNCRADLQRLESESLFLLDGIQTDIAGIELNRDALAEKALERMQETSFLLLLGPAGVGKSGLWKALVGWARAQGACFTLSWDRLTGPGWSGQAQSWGLRASLSELVTAFSGASAPILFIDGLDRIVEQGARNVVNDVMREIQRLEADWTQGQRWKIVATCREENLSTVLSWVDPRSLAGRNRVGFERFSVEELSDSEIEYIAEQIPRLRPLSDAPALRPVLRNLAHFSVLADPRALPDDQLPDVATEAEISRLWWERIIGSLHGDVALGSERQQTLLRLGEAAIASPGSWQKLSATGLDANALRSLCEERILSRDPNADRFRVRRDPFEEWVLARVLAGQREKLGDYLLALEQPLGLSRALGLMGASLLERGELRGWVSVLASLEAAPTLSSRWRSAWLTSPLLSTRALNLWPLVAPTLAEDGGRRLREILLTLRTVEVKPNVSIAEHLADLPEHEREAAMLHKPVPRIRVWARLFHWLLGWWGENEAAMSEATWLELADVLEIYQRTTAGLGEEWPFRRQIALLAFRWLDEIEAEDQAKYGARDADPVTQQPTGASWQEEDWDDWEDDDL